MAEKCCQTCRHWDAKKDDIVAPCGAPVPEWIDDAFRELNEHADLGPNADQRDSADGGACSLWASRPKEES